MKKLFLLPILFLIACIIPLSAHAASVGNPDTLGKTGAVSLGIEYDHMNQPLKLKSGTVSDGMFSEDFNSNNMYLNTQTESIVARVGITPHLDAVAKLGVAKMKLGGDIYYADSEGSDSVRVTNGSNFAYSLGVVGQIQNIIGNIALNYGAQYNAFKAHGRFALNDVDIADMFYPSASYNSRTTVHEWQAHLTVSTHVSRLNPYAGVVLRKTSVHNLTNIQVPGFEGYNVSIDAKMKQKRSVDGVVGTAVAITDHVVADVEYQPRNKEFNAGVSYNF